MVLNGGWSQTIYHYQITSCMCSETGSEWNKCCVTVLDILLSYRVTLHKYTSTAQTITVYAPSEVLFCFVYCVSVLC